MIHWTVLGAVALLGGLLVVSRVLSALLRRTDAGFTAITYVEVTLKVVAVVGAYNLTVVGEPGAVAASAVGSPLAAVAVNALLASVVAYTGVRVVVRGVVPLVKLRRPGTYTLPDRFRRRHRRTIFGLAVALAVLAEAVRLGALGVSGAWVVVAIGVAWSVYQIRASYFGVPPLGEGRIRDPTDEERERIERCYDRFGRSPGRVVVVADDTNIELNVVGQGPYHSVGVTEQFLERVDDTTLAIALAQADERSAAGYWTLYLGIVPLVYLYLAVIFLVWPAFLLGLFTTSSPFFWFVMPLLVFVPVPPAVWLGRRSVYTADRFVTSQFDTSTIAAVYRELGEDLRYHRVPGRLFNKFLSLDPTIEQRLERLSIESSDERPEPDERGDASAADESPTGDDQPRTDQDTVTSHPQELDNRWRRWLLVTTGLAALSPVATVPVAMVGEAVIPNPELGALTLLLLFVLSLAGLTSFVTWLLLPVVLYLDSRATRSVTDWPSHRILYLVGAVVPTANILVAVVYLWRRPRSV